MLIGFTKAALLLEISQFTLSESYCGIGMQPFSGMFRLYKKDSPVRRSSSTDEHD
jgi:hypothetical protein